MEVGGFNISFYFYHYYTVALFNWQGWIKTDMDQDRPFAEQATEAL